MYGSWCRVILFPIENKLFSEYTGSKNPKNITSPNRKEHLQNYICKYINIIIVKYNWCYLSCCWLFPPTVELILLACFPCCESDIYSDSVVPYNSQNTTKQKRLLQFLSFLGYLAYIMSAALLTIFFQCCDRL